MILLATALPWLQIIIAILLVAAILLQQNEASLGTAFGGSNAAGNYHTKRGAEKALFVSTIVLAVLFGLTGLIALFV